MMTPLCQRWSRPESWIPSPAREEFPPWRRSQKASNLPVWMFKTLINNFLLPRIPGIFTSLVRAEKFLISINARWGSLTLTEHRRHRGLDMTRLGEDKLHVTRLHLSSPDLSLSSLCPRADLWPYWLSESPPVVLTGDPLIYRHSSYTAERVNLVT